MLTTANQKLMMGLDPMFRSCLKLQIKDVMALKSAGFDDFPDLLCFKENHIVQKVEVMGIVVRVDIKPTRKSYAVDDGTGVISCVCWKNKRTESQSVPILDLPPSLMEKQRILQSVRQFDHEGYTIGDHILVRGRVTQFMGKTELDVLDHRKIDDPNYECERILSLPALYRHYNKPAVPPKKVLQELCCSPTDGDNTSGIRAAIVHHLQSCPPSFHIFNMSDVLSWPAVRTALTFIQGSLKDEEKPIEEVISQALEAVENSTGSLFKRNGPHGRYEVVRYDSPVVMETLTAVQTSCSSGRNIERGCHILHIRDVLKTSSSHWHIGEAVLKNVLDLLEESGDVISLGQHRYLPVSPH